MTSVIEPLWRHAEERPGADAVVDGATRLNWAALAEMVRAAARRLRALGVADGDRIALIGADGAATLVAALAVLAAGAVHCPIDATLAEPETAAAMEAVRVRFLIRIARGAAPGAIEIAPTGRSPLADPLGAGNSAFIRCSSGTTGAAKGVLLSHRTIRERVAAANRGLALGADDRVLWLLPMAYHFAVSVLLYLERGAAIVFGNSLRAAGTAAIARAESVTFAYASPYHVRRLAELSVGQDLPATLRALVSTTSALDATAAADFRARHQVPVRQALGIIEVGLPLVSVGAADEVPGEFGVPLPDYHVVALDQDGVEVPAGQPGELAISGVGLLDAYLEPYRSREWILERGFFRSGDIVAVERDGRVRLLGRSKDVINVGGVKVFPLEVESVINAYPGVASSRVRASSDPRTGECVHAEVTLKPGFDAAIETDLAAWCAARLASLKRPASFAFLATLPMTGSGKVRRRSLSETTDS